MFKKTIGILGGMGPVASADTYMALIRICQQQYEAVQDSDFPTVVLYSLPLQEFDHIGFTENSVQRKAILDQLVKALYKLEDAGAEMIVIDCNTVHYFLNELQAVIKTPIINLVQLTVDHLLTSKYQQVGVICSQTSKDLNLYAGPLEAARVKVINTSVEEQDKVNEAILAVMSGSVTPHHIAKLNQIIWRFKEAGAQCVVMGCTEISNIARQFDNKTILVDSEILAIEKALELAK